MQSPVNALTAGTRRLWLASRPLTAAGLGLLMVFGVTLTGLAIDPRVITGAPAWLKPAKFAISTGVYALTLAWVMTYLQGWPRLTRLVGWSTAAVMVIEVALIGLQAARGVTSHFNVATTFDTAVFAVMGISILVAWVMSVALTVALFRQTFADPALGCGDTRRDADHRHRIRHRGLDDAVPPRRNSRTLARLTACPLPARTRWGRRTEDPGSPGRDGAANTGISACRTSSGSTRSRRFPRSSG